MNGAPRSDGTPDVAVSDGDVAIVGMSGRFPSAPDPDALWQRVVAGDDCLTDLDARALAAAGVPRHVAASPNFVRRSGVLAGVDMFDAGFFGIGARDAAIMDPQQRHFLECSWEALESAAVDPQRFDGAIGVFAGCGMNTYLLNNLLTHPGLLDQVGWFLLRHTGNDKDFLATTVAYRLDLRGPAVNVQTACSTSLVAVHLAAQSLLGFECDLALAGGATIEFPHGAGYEYREGEILAPDGRCRAFDERSAGTVLTSGVGVVALRRLADALRDGDPVLAVIKGSAINNDGARKVGYLAPSVDGHADVVKEALAVAGVDAGSIQLLEAHGTGTAVGDPIEVAALTEAFRASTDGVGFCRLTSTKPNIGHLDTAAGVASLIKVVQALRHQVLPPLANHTAPSPHLDLARSPFVLSGEAAPWAADGPRRAGVSSLGVGGTNAHVIVEEAPAVTSPPTAGPQLLLLSGRERGAVGDGAGRLAEFLEQHPTTALADVAHTLAAGRRAMDERLAVCVADVADAVAQLRRADPGRAATSRIAATPPAVTFMFPGGGAQYAGMGAGLDQRYEVFHRTVAEGVAAVQRHAGFDLAPLLRPNADPAELGRPTRSLPAVFVTAVALARQWMAFGVRPASFLGHSLGEYVAAHLAGVLTLDDAVSLVITRSRLMEQASGDDAAMLVVPLGPGELAPLLGATLSLATVNAHDECVVAGTGAAVRALAERLPDVHCTLIPLGAAAHSHLLDPVLDEFRDAVRRVRLAPPGMRYTSNVTGTWITAEQATDPDYWVDHLRSTVRFADCLDTVLTQGPTVLVELGPGHSLSSYARRAGEAAVDAIPALRHPQQAVDDTLFTTTALGRLWTHGIDVDLGPFTGPGHRRIPLPTYAFQRQHHWIEPGRPVATTTAPSAAPLPRRIDDPAANCQRIEWRPAVASRPARPAGRWWVLAADDDDLAARVAGELATRGASVGRTADIAAVLADGGAPDGIVLFSDDRHRDPVARWLDDAAACVRRLAAADAPRLLAVTRGALAVDGPAHRPVDALAAGVVAVAPHEHPNVVTRLVDVPVEGTDDVALLVDDLLAEGPPITARRHGQRLVAELVAADTVASDEHSLVREGGTYLVTGGLGGVGHVLATHLARQHSVNLVVVSSAPVPSGPDRAHWLATHGYDDETSRRIRRLQQLEALGAKVTVVEADVSDPASLRRALDEAEALAGHLDGAVHAAGRLDDQLIELADPATSRRVVAPKALAAAQLADELARRDAELLVLVGSTSTVLAPPGQSAYVAANAVLDALAGQRDGLSVRTVDFGLWSGTGIASEAARRERLDIDETISVDHPVLTSIRRRSGGAVELVGRLATDHHWVVDEHRSGDGTAVLPGTGHLELMLTAARLAGRSSIALADVTMLEPITVADGRPTTVRVTVGGEPEPHVAIDTDHGGEAGWHRASEARLVAVAGDAPMSSAEVPVVAGAAGETGLDPLARPRRHLTLGPRWDAVQTAHVAGDTAVATLRLAPSYAAEATSWHAHPALTDVATAVAVALGPGGDTLHVPVGYGRVRAVAPLPAALTVIARRRGEAPAGALLRVDLRALDEAGATVLEIDDLQLLGVAPGHLGAVATPSPADATATATGAHATSLVELADELGLRAPEGAAVFDRLVTGREHRLVASTIDLAELAALVVPPEPDAPAERSAPTARTTTTVEDALRAMWVDLLGVAEPADDADFFDLGGQSLIAIRLMTRIQRELGPRLQLAAIFEAPTIAGLAALVRAARPGIDDVLAADQPVNGGPATAGTAAPMTRHLVPISTEGEGRPLHVVHGAGGNVLFLWSLARALAGRRPVLGFQAHGIEGGDMPDPSVEAMAARYVAELREAGPGPYLLGGFSGGGIVTLEMVKQLQAAGETVDCVVLFDSVPPGKAGVPTWERRRRVLRHALQKGPGAVKPYLRRQVADQVHRFLPERRERTLEHDAQARALGYADTDTHGFVNLYYYFSAAADRYVPGVYDVDALLLKAGQVWPTQPDDYHWTRHVTGRLDVRVVPGDHHSMFYPEHAPHLAAVLDDALRERGL